MPLGVCTLYTVAGSLVWNAVIVTTGHLLAGQWERVLVVTEPFPTIALVLISGLVVSLVVRSVRRSRRTRAVEERVRSGLTHAPLEDVVDDLATQAATDPVLWSTHHPD